MAWAYEAALDLLRSERERAAALTEKAAQLAGFTGIILAILGSLARDGFKANLGCVGDVVFAVAYFAAALTLALAIGLLIIRVYRPQRFIAIDADEIANFLDDDRLLRAKPWALQIRHMRTLHGAAKWAERGAEQMAARIKFASWVFVSGLFCFLVAVLTLGVGQL